MKKIAAGHGPAPSLGVNSEARHSPSVVRMLTSSRAMRTSVIEMDARANEMALGRRRVAHDRSVRPVLRKAADDVDRVPAVSGYASTDGRLRHGARRGSAGNAGDSRR